MTIAHYIVTALLLLTVIWLVTAEIKRMSAAKELAQNTTPPVATV
jgi:uncharacterized membrane protein